MAKNSLIPEPLGECSDDAWGNAGGEVARIQASTITNTPGLERSIQGKTEDLRRQINALKALRLARNLTQQQLAQGGLSQSHISKIENGDPTALTLATFARFVAASGGELQISAVYGTDTYPLDFNTNQRSE